LPACPSRSRSSSGSRIAGAILALAVTIIGPVADIAISPGWTIWFGAHPSWLETAAAFAAGNTGFVLDFAILAGAGLYYRRRPDLHGRLMLLACLPLLAAALPRALVFGAFMVGYGPPIGDAMTLLARSGFFVSLALPFYAAFVVHDFRTLGRIHRATLCGGAVAFLLQPLAMWIVNHTEAGKVIAAAAAATGVQ
jgi:hypothetical protein